MSFSAGVRSVQIPRISHLQAAVINCLTREMSGREIREAIAEIGVQQSQPAFYRLMQRMEQQGFVSGRYVNGVTDGQIVRERHYRSSRDGKDAIEEARDFYRKTQ